MIQYIHLNLKAFQSGVFYLSDNYLKTYLRSEWYSYLQLHFPQSAENMS